MAVAKAAQAAASYAKILQQYTGKMDNLIDYFTFSATIYSLNYKNLIGTILFTKIVLKTKLFHQKCIHF